MVISMKRKKQLYEELKAAERELKELTLLVKYEDNIPTEDEIHGWAIRMNACVAKLQLLEKEVLEFYKN
jgi:hypothetical protein